MGSMTSSRRILVVDDEPVSRTLVVAALKRAGHEVQEVGRLGEASDLLSRDTFDLLVIDGLLPDGMGADLIAQLRKRGNSIPVVFITSFYRKAQSSAELRRLNISALLHKPINPGELVPQVNRLLGVS